jgi:2-keto-4-pentenoate hydratase/2-oxohepta-3-ene-1,7-dioic acid hydratase in catechol pathway
MKLLYFLKKDNKKNLGVQTKKGIVDIDAYQAANNAALFSYRNIETTDIQALQNIVNAAGDNFYVSEKDIIIASAVLNPSKIICIGLNYRKHAIESGMAIPAIPVVFTKYNNTLINFEQNVSLGKAGEQFDYEVELAVVIGKKCKDISKENALGYVLGYTVANDMSCRDLQFRTSQWLMGKSLDTFLPLGRYVVTADEVGNPQQLQLNCTVNGEQRQNSNTADMVFSVAEIIEDLSKHMTLEPGDLILTGTPEGVIMGLPEKVWLQPGDAVKVEIEKLGSTTNTMSA